ncbi:hypothetical protein JZ751_014913 [Albula glossodonta]|uniref:non-specific serine/threonine protein kinase n=1 Tax=Albula glossodonta TaxID=121402 RepID=A0A8T2MY02_9TELE|nr:hypothetical protein JZ751_014913 [Albula glossodonta]
MLDPSSQTPADPPSLSPSVQFLAHNRKVDKPEDDSEDIKAVVDGIDGIKISQGLGLGDFDLIRVIGRGSYAKVLLVRLKKNDQIYAMKVVKKELVHDDEVREGGMRDGGRDGRRKKWGTYACPQDVDSKWHSLSHLVVIQHNGQCCLGPEEGIAGGVAGFMGWMDDRKALLRVFLCVEGVLAERSDGQEAQGDPEWEPLCCSALPRCSTLGDMKLSRYKSHSEAVSGVTLYSDPCHL